jgi:hypothetical protein
LAWWGGRFLSQSVRLLHGRCEATSLHPGTPTLARERQHNHTSEAMPGARVDSKRRPGLRPPGSTQAAATDADPSAVSAVPSVPLCPTSLVTICARRPAGIKLWPPGPCRDVISSTPIDERETMTDVTRSIWTLVLSNVAVRPEQTFTAHGFAWSYCPLDDSLTP